MAVNKLKAREDYVGDGVTTDFGFDNWVLADGDLNVYQDGVLATIIVDYTLTGVGTDAVSVAFVVAPAVAVAVALVRKTGRVQNVGYPSGGTFPSVATEGALDRGTLIDHEQDEEAARALTFAESSTASDIVVPDPEALKVFRWNAAGDGLENVDLVALGAAVLSNLNALKFGLAAPGTSTEVSRFDHVHPPEADFFDFNEAVVAAYKEGRITYQKSTGTFLAYDDITGTALNLGTEVRVRVINKSGAQIDDGESVYIDTSNAQLPTIELAKADTRVTAEMVGVVTANIADNAQGWSTVIGNVNDIDLSAFSSGDTLWLSPTVAGGYVNVKPDVSLGHYVVQVGHVSNAHITQGKLLVQPSRPLDQSDITINGLVSLEKGADIASAATLVLGTDGNSFDITGAADVTEITVTAGTWFMLQFDGAVPLTHSATLFLNNDGANYTTSAGDIMLGYAFAANSVRGVIIKADGTAMAAGLTSGNRLVNGLPVVNQRGAQAGVSATTYFADRWEYQLTASTAIVDLDIGTAVSEEWLEVDITTADAAIAAGDLVVVQQKIEGFNVADLHLGDAAAATVTISFKHAHTKTGIHCLALKNSAENRNYIVEYTQAVADVEETTTKTINLDQAGTWLVTNGIGLTVAFSLAAGSTFQGAADVWQAGNLYATANQVNDLDNVANFFRVREVQIELGSAAKAFEQEDYSVTINKCYRYFQTFGNGVHGHCGSTTSVNLSSNWVVAMRANPTLTLVDTTPTVFTTANFTGTASTISFIGYPRTNGQGGLQIDGFTGLGAGDACLYNEGITLATADAEL